MPSATQKSKAHRAERVARKKHRHKRRHFLVAWIRAPLKVGALMPSSRGLARAMARQVDLTIAGTVIELGAGTGAMTHALLETGIQPNRLLIVERDSNLHTILSSQFHGLNIVCADAAELDHVLFVNRVKHVNAIVSSLPLLSMPKKIRYAIEERMAATISEKGIIVQFTYGPNSPLRRAVLRKYQLTGKRVKTVIANMPPAHVWVYRKAS